MLVTDEIPSFERDVIEYCERQVVSPSAMCAHLKWLVERKTGLIHLNKELYGLRVAPLKASGDQHETLLLIDHENGNQRYVVFVSILRRPLENFLWPCKEPICKRKINTAVARLILMSKAYGSGTNAVGF